MNSIRPLDLRRRPPRRPPTERQRRAAWARFVRQDRDWAWSDLLAVIDFKLGRMEAVIANGWGGERRERVAEIRGVRRLIKRIIANRYREEITRAHRKRWGPLRFRDGRQHAGSVEVVFYFPKAKTAREQTRAQRSYDVLMRRAEVQRHAHLNELFALMARHIQQWWE